MSNSQIVLQTQFISQEQLELLKQLAQFQTSIQFNSPDEVPLSGSIQHVNSKQFQEKQTTNHQLPQITGKKQSSEIFSPMKRKQSSLLFSESKQNPELNLSSQPLFLLNKELESSGPKQYYLLKQKLLKYKEKSDQIYKVGEFIKSYQQNFTQLVKQKDQLVNMLKQIKGQTSHLVEKQKHLIDLSMAIKQSLDYYTYHDKNQFNFACEISSRQLFQDSLQSTLSSIMDGIQFFNQNLTYVSSKKHLNQYLVSKSKTLSFIKSFFVKLINKENNFSMKNIQANKLFIQFQSLYPKSRINLLTNFLLTFPQLKRHLKQALIGVKDQQKNNQKKQQLLDFLLVREHEISQFQLSEPNIALIGYLEKNNFEIYSEVMLNLWSFNRLNYHQNLIFLWVRNINSENSGKKLAQQSEASKEKWNFLKRKIYYVIQIIIAEYFYFILSCHPTLPQSFEFITSWLYKLIFKYLQVLIKQTRQFVIKFKFNPFDLCQKIQHVIDNELASYFQNLSKEQYESFVMGRLWLEIIKKEFTLNQGDKKFKLEGNQHYKLLKQIFKNTIKSKIITELSPYCFQHLPKIQPSDKKQQIEENINKLVYFIPKLQYCSNHAQNYMISSLDVLIKSVKQINLNIQSRFQCYAWNLIAFGSIRNVLKNKKFQIVSKQIRLDFNESLNIIDRVKRLQRSESLIKYAQDIFNVIKTGMPSLNQLTLDFNKYVNEHYEELQSRFLKDILFIYAKNMIQFLQRMMQSQKRISSQKSIKNEQDIISQTQINQQQKSPKNQKKISSKEKDQTSKLCDPYSAKSLYSSYVLSIQKYIKQARQILKIMQESKIKNKDGEIENLKILIRQVYEKLFDFLDSFYVMVSEYRSEITAEFQEISKIKQKQQSLWFICNQKSPKEKNEQN